MDKELTTLSSKGQLVIPKSFRQKLGLRSGDFIGVLLSDDLIILKKLQVPEDKVARDAEKAVKAAKELGFSFEEMLYPEKR